MSRWATILRALPRFSLHITDVISLEGGGGGGGAGGGGKNDRRWNDKSEKISYKGEEKTESAKEMQ